MIESFVDLTYRGLALGRRIKLAEVRPTSALVELAAPMPVGTQLAIVTDDGVTLEASVVWVHEQVQGSDKPPGMIVAPVLAAETAAAWWKERVALPDDDRPRRPTRSRPVTVRPRPITERTRGATDRTPPPAAAIADEVTVAEPAPTASPTEAATESPYETVTREAPAIMADLAARVTAAAGLAPTVADERSTVAMSPIDQARLADATRPDEPRRISEHVVPRAEAELARRASEAEPRGEAEPARRTGEGEPLRRTGEHAVVDDGNATMIMDAVDPALLGLDFPTSAEAAPVAIGDEPSAPTIIIESGGPGEPTVTTEAAAIADDGDGDDEPPAAGADKPAGRTFKRRRKRR